MPINRVKVAIEAIKRGEMVVMVDDEDRENEGDLVYAATFSTPKMVNFMASEAKGLICVALEREQATRLELNPMVSNNNSSYETAFTVSVDAKEALTGISAGERDMTIKLLADPLCKADELVRPGHIFPLIAKEGGVLNRTGHTEGAVDLCKLSGVVGAGVICEIMKEDGEMARRDDLEIFSKNHNMPIVYIADLIAYRLERESLIAQEIEKDITFFGADIKELHFKDHQNRQHRVLQFGELSKNQNVKFHTVGTDLELLSNATQYNGLISAIEYLKENGGLLIFIDNSNQQVTAIKDIGIGAQILRFLGVDAMTLLVTKEVKDFVGLTGFDLEITKEIVLN
jgi:3,4-dihydroxy 2-butanone 4-phosphate synthase / GTP cyclohydrolase II